jgi:hypothetical protein
MTPAELETWLGTDEAQRVGQKNDGGESVGHESGRTVGYVHRHLAQRPAGDVTGTRWRYSLMNWGHDPLRD